MRLVARALLLLPLACLAGVGVALVLQAVSAAFGLGLETGAEWWSGCITGLLCGLLPWGRWLFRDGRRNGS
jgi:hypothetical protein